MRFKFATPTTLQPTDDQLFPKHSASRGPSATVKHFVIVYRNTATG